MIRTLLQQRCKEETHVVKEAIDATGFGEGGFFFVVSFLCQGQRFLYSKKCKEGFSWNQSLSEFFLDVHTLLRSSGERFLIRSVLILPYCSALSLTP